MAPKREHSLKAIENAGLEIKDSGLNRVTQLELFEHVGQLEPKQKQLCLAEAATRTFLNYLTSIRPLYPEFEDLIWQQFLSASDLQGEIESLLKAQKHFIAVPNKYYNFLRGMFEKSGKSRHNFYNDMLSEDKIEIGPEDIAFGSAAVAFAKRAMLSVHEEHLLVFYSVELLIRAHVTAHPRGSPMSRERLETFYRHFEAAIPLAEKFEKYTKDSSLFLYNAEHWLLPSID